MDLGETVEGHHCLGAVFDADTARSPLWITAHPATRRGEGQRLARCDSCGQGRNGPPGRRDAGASISASFVSDVSVHTPRHPKAKTRKEERRHEDPRVHAR